MFSSFEGIQEEHGCRCCGQLIRTREEIKRQRQSMIRNSYYFRFFEESIENFWQQLEDRDVKRDQIIESIYDFVEKQFHMLRNKMFRLVNTIVECYKSIDKRLDTTYESSILSKKNEVNPAKNQQVSKLIDPKGERLQDQELIIDIYTPALRKSTKKQQENAAIRNIVSWLNENEAKISECRPNIINKAILKIDNQKTYRTIEWSLNPAFNVNQNIITMQFDGWYKLRTKNPIPKSGKHFFKFKVHNQTTVSFGIVVQQLKSGKFINDKLNGTISYVSFQTGAGMVKHDGEIVAKGLMTHISPQTNLQMTIDFDEYKLTFKNSRSEPLHINMGRKFPSCPIYAFLHMKNSGTIIEVLEYSTFQ